MVAPLEPPQYVELIAVDRTDNAESEHLAARLWEERARAPGNAGFGGFTFVEVAGDEATVRRMLGETHLPVRSVNGRPVCTPSALPARRRRSLFGIRTADRGIAACAHASGVRK